MQVKKRKGKSYFVNTTQEVEAQAVVEGILPCTGSISGAIG